MIRTVPAVLDRAREYTEPALRDAVRRLQPQLQPAVRYHLGWADESGNPTSGGGGKGIRPALAILSAEATGALASVGVPGAVAVELVHNFSLLHDDVIDGDRERRHRPTVWALFGIGEAIIVGDALHTLAHAGAARVGHVGRDARCVRAGAGDRRDDRRAGRRHGVRDLRRHVARRVRRDGGRQDRRAARVRGVDRCAPLRRRQRRRRRVAAFGRELGLAFQAVDDLLGIWGEPEVTGKPTWSDLRSQKKTLPVVFALSRDDARAEELRSLFSNGPLEEAQVARAARLVERCGGRELTEARRRPAPRGRARRAGVGPPRTDRARGAGRAGPLRDDEGVLNVARRPPAALDRARDALLGLQDGAGWWKGELETNVTMDAEDLFLRQFLGVDDAGADRRTRDLDPLAAARRRDVGDLLRGPGRPLDDGRGVRRAAARRRRAGRRPHVEGRATSSATPAGSSDPACSPACGWRCSAPGRGTTLPALPPEMMLLPASGAAQHLRLRLLGPPDDRRAHGRRPRCRPCAALGVRHRRAAQRPPAVAGTVADDRAGAASARSTASCTATSGTRSGALRRRRARRPRSGGSSTARRRTARGAASSRRGSAR